MDQPNQPTSPSQPPDAQPPAASQPPGGAQPVVSWEPQKSGEIPVPGAPGLAFATTGERFVAYLIDAIIIAIVAFVVSVALGVGDTTVRRGEGWTNVYTTANGVVSALIGLAYFVASWTGGRRATPGQRVLRLQVGNAFDGQGLTLQQAVIRALGLGEFLGLLAVIPGLTTLIPLVGLLWNLGLLISTATSPTKQGFHDRLANSAVVRPAGAGAGWATGCLIIVALVIVLGIVGIVGLIFLGANIQDILSQVGQSV